MGRKADALLEELEIVEGERDAYRRRTAELEAELAVAKGTAAIPVGALIKRNADTGEMEVRSPNAQDLLAVTTRAWANGEATAEELRAAIDHADRAESTSRIADAESAIAELVRPGPPPEKQDTLTDIVRANNRERAELNVTSARTNTILSRVASALGVPRWDHDGTEILEKAQRFTTYSHWLKQRLKGYEAKSNNATEIILAEEVRTVLAAFVAPEHLSKYIIERKPSAITLAMAAAAEEPAPEYKLMNRADLLELRDASAAHAAERGKVAPPWLAMIARSEMVSNDFVDLVNLVILPALQRAGVVTKTRPVG